MNCLGMRKEDRVRSLIQSKEQAGLIEWRDLRTFDTSTPFLEMLLLLFLLYDSSDFSVNRRHRPLAIGQRSHIPFIEFFSSD